MKKYLIISIVIIGLGISALFILQGQREKAELEKISQISEITRFHMACLSKYEELKSKDMLSEEEKEQLLKIRKEIDGFIKDYPDSLVQVWNDSIR